jgi:uncharacterized protein (TIGR01777 family)
VKIIIAGSTGLVGSALIPVLRSQGHEVLRLVRSRPKGPDEIPWNPARRELALPAIEGADAIVNLSGENVSAGRWTAARRARIRDSRVDATATLVGALAKVMPKPAVLVNASAVGFYGDRGDDILTEVSEPGTGFLAEVCQAWENEAEAAHQSGVRAVRLRFGVILSSKGGALAKMLPVFRLGLGGRLGSGKQWMSWVSLDDVLGAIGHALVNPACTGPVNVVAPGAVTNAEFTVHLGASLRRPAVLPVPAAILRLGLGQMADEALLASTRAVPRALEDGGYVFRHPKLALALDDLRAE